jgi:hypothetical protein
MTDDSPTDGLSAGFARLRRWALVVYGLVAIGLIPWTAHLGSSLPSRHETAHWDVLWAGFDIGLLVAFGATAVAVLRFSPLLPIVASVTGTLLLCDAWFDLLTSTPGSERLWASVEAVLGELPLAGFSFWVAYDAEKVLVTTRRYVEARRLRRREAGATTD